MIDRQKFFTTIHTSLFDNMNQSQVDGINAILDEYERLGWDDVRKLAYLLATVKHETANKFQPTKEYGGETYLKSKKYYPYYGRDLLQTTWDYNYKKVAAFSGIDVVTNPDLIGELSLAVKVAFHFMEKGLYTGKKLSDFIGDKCNFVGARRIINGNDKDNLIASYANSFLTALK